ncbi:N-acetyl-1-D-myo-inositol-2-amino-2-deoxy-alpha-D -glucopyranoside deacetylase [Ornithinimicrobium humiphilum]|uniref:N-acetyl-1-D-myo-inositol-2-amino-2-deoxy-alpha-D-glucopyranoside deacetylase n=1 Tax=Ornithinimicrobium humiphilum TaxID=125288 RepID=A0A543KR27_9MICO|nr:N-acetyl-1-D-myo-inositol-2-amino-2-deoxy-alpha-D-glucopyranoside deacetylase [Ornithinimicrobium humiphilum]TQM97528.1 N-acetyl-1-D-myo-inositol-2-amino-2-deoxy-alpha-D-glucopyranoside deacetylase [Ornithinimicrobium humiphilum]
MTTRPDLRDGLPLGRRLRVVAVHAHPDDETLATGVALASHAAAGDEVHVITCTLGEEGEVIPPELVHLEGTGDLGPHRVGEVRAATAVLGARHHWLGGDPPRWRDSGMAGSPAAAHPRAFASADVGEAAGVLADLLEELRPDLVLTYDPHGGYGHPDHVQTHRVTVAAVARLPREQRPRLYMVLTPRSWAEEDREWLRAHVPEGVRSPAGGVARVPAPDDPFPPSVVDDGIVTHAVVDLAARDRQAAALREHPTQVTVHDGWYTLSNDIAARLPGREGYALLEVQES